MPESPISPTPYEVLGVSASASAAELRRAYRRMQRQTHPDTGGSAARFAAVQEAWERIGTPEGRAAYDRGAEASGASAAGPAHTAWATPTRHKPTDSRATARSYGHPGGWRREHYLELVREWVGRGTHLENPFDPALVRSAPREIRHQLADALAEEQTARTLAQLGIGYTVWHDVATDAVGGGPANKIDHVVLGPTGLFALLSEDWGEPVRVRRGELIGEGLKPGERPMHALSLRAKSVARGARVKFTGLLIVVPDGASAEGLEVLGTSRGAVTAVVQHPRLMQVLRDGLPGSPRIGGTDLFEVRTRLQAAVRFV